MHRTLSGFCVCKYGLFIQRGRVHYFEYLVISLFVKIEIEKVMRYQIDNQITPPSS